MHVPSRKVKNQLRIYFGMILVFAGTLCVCIAVAFFLLRSGAAIISPITKTYNASSDQQVAQVKYLCEKDGITYKDIFSLPDGSLEIVLDSGGTVFLSSQKNLKNQLASLQQALSQLTIKGKQFKTLDFRFATAVVSF